MYNINEGKINGVFINFPTETLNDSDDDKIAAAMTIFYI